MRASVAALLMVALLACRAAAREPMEHVVAVDPESVLLASRDGRVCRLAWRSSVWTWCQGGGARSASAPVVVDDAVALVRDDRLVVLDLAAGTPRLTAPRAASSPPMSIVAEPGLVIVGDWHELIAYDVRSGAVAWRRAESELRPSFARGVSEPLGFARPLDPTTGALIEDVTCQVGDHYLRERRSADFHSSYLDRVSRSGKVTIDPRPLHYGLRACTELAGGAGAAYLFDVDGKVEVGVALDGDAAIARRPLRETYLEPLEPQRAVWFIHGGTARLVDPTTGHEFQRIRFPSAAYARGHVLHVGGVPGLYRDEAYLATTFGNVQVIATGTYSIHQAGDEVVAYALRHAGTQPVLDVTSCVAHRCTTETSLPRPR